MTLDCPCKKWAGDVTLEAETGGMWPHAQAKEGCRYRRRRLGESRPADRHCSLGSEFRPLVPRTALGLQGVVGGGRQAEESGCVLALEWASVGLGMREKSGSEGTEIAATLALVVPLEVLFAKMRWRWTQRCPWPCMWVGVSCPLGDT